MVRITAVKRRTLLGTLGACGLVGLGGCASPPTAASSSSPESRSTSTPPDDLQRRVSLNDQDAVPDEHEVRIEATLLESTITDIRTARLRVTLTNDGPTRRLSVSSGGCALFNRYDQASDPRGLWLALDEESGRVAEAGPRWIAEPPENGAYSDYGCAPRTFEPEESITSEYAVFHDDRAGGYLEPHTYLFRTDVHVAPDPVGEGDDDDSIVFNWGLALTVENPHCTLCL